MKPQVLLLYYSFTQHTRRVAESMAEAFRAEGCEAELCAIEFNDERYRIALPFRPFWPKLLRWCWPQLQGKSGAVRVPDEVLNRDYDLSCIGSPTWWLKPAMPVASFLKTTAAGKLLRGKRFAAFAVCRALWWNNLRIVKKLARRQGGTFVDGAAFRFRGNQIQSFLSLINYMQSETNRARYCGISICEFGVPQNRARSGQRICEMLGAGSPWLLSVGRNAAVSAFRATELDGRTSDQHIDGGCAPNRRVRDRARRQHDGTR